MCLEAFIYERAQSYEAELPTEVLATWQPRKLLNAILDIDPSADKSASLAVGLEDTPGKPAKTMHSLGAERALSLAELRKYYDRLGSFVHTPTRNEIEHRKGPTPESIRGRCLEVVEIVEAVLESPVFNLNFRITTKLECLECQSIIVRRMPPGHSTLVAECLCCKATYNVHPIEDGGANWEPRRASISCPVNECDGVVKLWETDVQRGTQWTCQKCSSKNQLVLGVSAVEG